MSRRMRQWSAPSYSQRDGRAASSVNDEGGSQEWSHARDVTDHVSDAIRPGVNGAPGTSAMSKSGSGDPGRRKWARVP
jgi:hypothetical protein